MKKVDFLFGKQFTK